MGEETEHGESILTESETITPIGEPEEPSQTPVPQPDSVPNDSEPKIEQKEPEESTTEVEVPPSKSLSPNVLSDKPPLVKRSQSEPNANGKPALSSLQRSPSRPMFSSSSFWDPDHHPTIEDQVKLCREIAKQLVSDDANAKSKGREMFERRVQKSAHWVTENEDSFQNYTSSEEDYHERTITDGPPNLRLLLDPRHVEDINTVQGVNEHIIATQETKTKDTCKTIVQDLTSPEVNPNRGNTLFAKRAQQSQDWIVDDVAETVIDAARDKLFRQVKQPQQPFNWSARWSPCPPLAPAPPVVPPIPIYSHQPLAVNGTGIIPGPVFSPAAPLSPISSRPSSSMSIMSQFRDFNARPKPFCRAY